MIIYLNIRRDIIVSTKNENNFGHSYINASIPRALAFWLISTLMILISVATAFLGFLFVRNRGSSHFSYNLLFLISQDISSRFRVIISIKLKTNKLFEFFILGQQIKMRMNSMWCDVMAMKERETMGNQNALYTHHASLLLLCSFKHHSNFCEGAI